MRENMTGRKWTVRLAAAAAGIFAAAGLYAVPACAAAVPTQAAAGGFRVAKEMESQTMNRVWLLPDSDTYYISEADVSWMDDEELMLARNEFYARRGRKFVTKSIRDYFNRQSWYRGYIEPENFSTDLFNRYEQANVDFIVSYENRRSQIRQQQAAQPKKENRLDGDNPTKEKKTEPGLYGEMTSTIGELNDTYGEITGLYKDALMEGWSRQDYETAGMNTLAAGFESPEDLGYMYRDLNGDGTGELLIGPMNTQLYGQGAVLDIYTVQDGIPVKVAASEENTSYYICEDDTICRELAKEDGNWELDYLDLEGTDLVCKDVLVMDEGRDAEKPWFVLGNTDEYAQDPEGNLTGVTAEDFDSISYEDASALRTTYPADVLELVPLGGE